MSLSHSLDPLVLRWRVLALSTWLAGAVLTGVREERRGTPVRGALLRLGGAVLGPLLVTNAAAIFRAGRGALARAQGIFATAAVVALAEIFTRGFGGA